jgi:dihydroxyacetone kinase-like protein
MAMKKLMNDPKQFVPEMMKGIAAANPDTIKWVPEYNLIMRADMPNPDKVSIVQGSGSGHEPAHIMIVGKGMLDAACPGDVFAAPPMGNVVESSKLLASPKGILHIVNNYSGDRMSFETAAEMLDAEDILVKTIYVDDDVAVQDSTWTVGRRGVAGNFFVIKAVGAAAEQGASLDELVELGEKVNSVVRSMGMALTGCTPPAKGQPIFTLEEDEIEMGVGIHGEPGRARKKMAGANEIVHEMVQAILTDRKPIFDEDGEQTGTAEPVFKKGDEVALMVNGLGGTPISELYLVYGIAADLLAKEGIDIWRSYVGEYCTSLEMAGMSITMCKVDDELKELFSAPAEIPIRVF